MQIIIRGLLAYRARIETIYISLFEIHNHTHSANIMISSELINNSAIVNVIRILLLYFFFFFSKEQI